MGGHGRGWSDMHGVASIGQMYASCGRGVLGPHPWLWRVWGVLAGAVGVDGCLWAHCPPGVCTRQRSSGVGLGLPLPLSGFGCEYS